MTEKAKYSLEDLKQIEDEFGTVENYERFKEYIRKNSKGEHIFRSLGSKK